MGAGAGAAGGPVGVFQPGVCARTGRTGACRKASGTEYRPRARGRQCSAAEAVARRWPMVATGGCRLDQPALPDLARCAGAAGQKDLAAAGPGAGIGLGQ